MTNNRLPIEELKRTSLLNAETPDAANSRTRKRFSGSELDEIMRDVGKRLKIAFNHDPNSEIARALLTDDSTIKQYTDGNRLPTAEFLIYIHLKTGINIHWLLTGKGERRVEAENNFTADEETKINQLAKQSGRTFDEMVCVLTMAMVEAHGKI